METKPISYPFLPLIVYILSFLLLLNNGKAFYKNIEGIELINKWIGIDRNILFHSDEINDGLPDHWSMLSWGGTTFIAKINIDDFVEGKNSIYIERTSDSGKTNFTQDIMNIQESSLIITFYSKGDGGVVIIWLQDPISGEWIREGFNGRRPYSASTTWQKNEFEIDIPEGYSTIKVLFQPNTVAYYDELMVGEKVTNDLISNRIINPGLEDDGSDESPLEWWSRITTISPINYDQPTGRISFLNISDFSRGNLDAIDKRAIEIGNKCAEVPEMTSWMIGLAPFFEQNGGDQAVENLFKLSLSLADNCPQPYLALARLYEEHSAYTKAVEYYRRAAELSGNNILSGNYLFREGLIRLRYTGEINEAIYSFEKAETYPGWESGDWYFGAAAYFLGQAYEINGDYENAINAYQRVIGCDVCVYHEQNALDAINRLVKFQNAESN